MSSSYRGCLKFSSSRHDAPRCERCGVCVRDAGGYAQAGRHVSADRGADAEAQHLEPALWVFSNDRRDRIKIVYWQRNGLCLWSKRLEGRDRFIFPRHIEGETVTIRGEQLEELLSGFDLWRQGHRELLLRRVG